MNQPDCQPGPEARATLDEYLDAVEHALVGTGASRADRRAVCDEIEAQALEMVFARTQGEPTEQDMLAVLAELDDPEAYCSEADSGKRGAAPEPVADDRPTLHRFALTAFLIPFVVVALMFVPFPHGEKETYIWWAVVSFLCVVFAVMAIRDIRARPDRFRGVGLAVFGMMAIPMLVVSVFAYLQLEQLLTIAYVEGGEIFGQESSLGIQRWNSLEFVFGTIIVVLLLVLNALLFRIVYRGCLPKRS